MPTDGGGHPASGCQSPTPPDPAARLERGAVLGRHRVALRRDVARDLPEPARARGRRPGPVPPQRDHPSLPRRPRPARTAQGGLEADVGDRPRPARRARRGRGTATPAVNTSTEGVIEVERRIAARPETVFSYFTDPERYRLWQGIDAELDPRPGGVFRVRMRRHARTIASGVFVEVEPPVRLVFA